MALRGIPSASQHSLYSNTSMVRIKNNKLPHLALEGSVFLSELLRDCLLLSGLLIRNWMNIFLSPECPLLSGLASLTLCGFCQLQEDDVGHG